MPDPLPIYDATTAEWERTVGPVTPDLPLLQTETTEVSPGGFQGCPEPAQGTLTGCSRWDDTTNTYRIEVLECRTDANEILAHEWCHVLIWLAAAGQDADPGHTRSDVWGVVCADSWEAM